jgi:hypothetical protein
MYIVVGSPSNRKMFAFFTVLPVNTPTFCSGNDLVKALNIDMYICELENDRNSVACVLMVLCLLFCCLLMALNRGRNM